MNNNGGATTPPTNQPTEPTTPTEPEPTTPEPEVPASTPMGGMEEPKAPDAPAQG